MTESSNVCLEYCNESLSPEWDNFIASISSICHEQSSVWAEAQKLAGWDPQRIYLRRNGSIVCGVQIIILSFPFLGKFGYVQQGPCINGANAKEVEMLLNEMKLFARRRKFQYLTVDLAYNLPELVETFEKSGFELHPDRLPPEATITSTLLIDLSLELDAIMTKFKSGRRKSIRAGLKHNLEIRTGTRDDIPMLFDLIMQTCERRNTKPLYPNVNFIYRLWDLFAPNNWIVMHIAETEGKPVCASLSFTFGDTFRNSIWGWSGEYVHLNASDVIDWKTICWAKENGFRYYDFVHLDTVSAKALLSGDDVSDEIKARAHYGSTFYKMRFGGDVMFYPGSYSYFPSKMKKSFFIFMAHTVLNNTLVKKAIQFVRKRANREN